MRLRGLLVAVCLCAVIPSCKNKADTAAAPDEQAIAAEKQLESRRDALLKAREKLKADRDQLDVKIKDIQAQGGDASAEIQQREQLDSQLESSTSDLISLLGTKLDAVKVNGDKATELAALESQVATLERSLLDREEKLAERERLDAQREADMAQRWKDSCTAATPSVIIEQPKGGNYTRQDVTAMIARAKGAMSKKGILPGDLPGPTAALEGQAEKALDGNDVSKAYFAAAQLAAQVDAIRIDRTFIQAKMARLQREIKAGQGGAAAQQEATTILGDVMTRYNDGQFVAANHLLDRLASTVER